MKAMRCSELHGTNISHPVLVRFSKGTVLIYWILCGLPPDLGWVIPPQVIHSRQSLMWIINQDFLLPGTRIIKDRGAERPYEREVVEIFSKILSARHDRTIAHMILSSCDAYTRLAQDQATQNSSLGLEGDR